MCFCFNTEHLFILENVYSSMSNWHVSHIFVINFRSFVFLYMLHAKLISFLFKFIRMYCLLLDLWNLTNRLQCAYCSKSFCCRNQSVQNISLPILHKWCASDYATCIENTFLWGLNKLFVCRHRGKRMRIDYFIVSEKFKDRIVACEMHGQGIDLQGKIRVFFQLL